MNIKVIASTGCGPCIATKRALDSKGIDYELIDAASLTEEQRNVLREAGTALPVVIVDGGRDSWRGFRPDKIDALAEVA